MKILYKSIGTFFFISILSSCFNEIQLLNDRETFGESEQIARALPMIVVIDDEKFTSSTEADLELTWTSLYLDSEQEGKVKFVDGEARLALDNIPTNKKGRFEVTFFQEGKPLLKGRISSLEKPLDRSEVRLRNCDIYSAVWDGRNFEGNCNWSIEATR